MKEFVASLFVKMFGLSSNIPAATGPMVVASLHYRIPGPDGTLTQIFYPTGSKTPGNAGEKRRKSVRPEVVTGTSSFSKTPRWLMAAFLDRIPHPLASSTPPLDGTYPVVIFSHGLGGSCDIYSKMCSDFASHGYVVVALEHEDGSASFAASHDGAEIEYRTPPQNLQYTRNDVISFRAAFLKKRISEVRAAVKFLLSTPNQLVGIPENVAAVIKVTNASKMFIAGHSFGGTSSVIASQELSEDKVFCGVLLHDLWSFPLPEEAIDRGVPVPCISVLSEPFSVSPEVRYTRRLLSASPEHSSFRILGSVHSSFSDTPWWFPSIIGKRAELRGSGDVNAVQANIVKLSVMFMEECVAGRPGLSSEQIKSSCEGNIDQFDCGQADRAGQVAVL